jgi:hypothetical protein
MMMGGMKPGMMAGGMGGMGPGMTQGGAEAGETAFLARA